ncbi:MAG: ribonucleotide-diphosphate reductase subunit beta [Solirubrobacteraceae bacterium]|nr:ribonucleotide-diphosphate reductase subunit beta [Solirubrobacteraceae bacterium]
MGTSTAPRIASQISYSDLYARWERGHWLATEIDFTQDRIDWQEKLTEGERAAALWFFALFFHGEDEVADDLSPYVEAAPIEEQTYFLTTQQVDESRHSVFFNRFMHEVVGLGDGTPGAGLQATEGHLTWGHRETFKNLAKVAHELHADRSPEKFAEAVTNYHVIVEGTLAQPGQHMMEAWLERRGILPGFLAGMQKISVDEQRHIAFGMKTLSDLYETDPVGIGDVIVDAVRTSGAALMAFAYPSGGRAFLEPMGVDLAALYGESMRALDSRLKGIGLTGEQRQRAMTIDPSLSFGQQGERVLQLLDAGYVGDGTLPKSKRPEDVEVLFSMIANVIEAYPPKDGTVVQFDLTDVGARHYVRSGGELEYHQGPHPAPSVSLRLSLDDFADLIAERANPVKLLLLRRLRISGDRGLLMGSRSIFGPAPGTRSKPTRAASPKGLALLRSALPYPGRVAQRLVARPAAR